jgi:hypothetical protein
MVETPKNKRCSDEEGIIIEIIFFNLNEKIKKTLIFVNEKVGSLLKSFLP